MNINNISYSYKKVEKRPRFLSRSCKKTAVILLSVLFVFCALFFLTPKKTKAQAALTIDGFLPSSAKELPDFGSATPLSAFYGGNVYAFVMDDNGLYFNIDDEYIYYDNFTVKNPTSVKRLNADTLLLLNNAILYTIDLTDLSKATEQYFFGTEPVSGRCFDVTGDYLATVDGNTIFIYSFIDGELSEKTTLLNIAKNSTPLCLNPNGNLFYVSADGKLIKYDVASRTTSVLLSDVGAVSKMIANEDTLYYTSPSALFAVDIKTGNTRSLSPQTGRFELGTFSFSSDLDIAFKNENLLITDPSLGAVQEFSAEENNLVFTGFAIASGKTAFNRIGKNSSAISCGDGSVAVLDGNKLTVVKNLSENLYSEDNFLNVFISDLPFVPDVISVGKDTVLIAGKSSKKITIISIESGAVLYSFTFSDNNITDVCYGGGNYYIAQIATGTGDDTAVYKIAETATDGAPTLILTAEDSFGSSTVISVDVYGNVFLSKNGYIYRAEKSGDSFASPVRLNDEQTSGILKIATDLAGNVFALTANSVSYVLSGEVKSLPLSSSVKSFAMSFDSKNVFFIRENDERIYKTDNIPNLAADDIPVPAEFKTTGESANAADFKTYELKEGTVCYKVKTEQDNSKFIFEKSEGGAINEYILICDVQYSTVDPVNGNSVSVEFAALLGRDKDKNPIFVLTEKNGITETTNVSITDKTRFITTDVSVYYIPVITENDDFCLKNGDDIVRLKAKTQISVISEITFSENGFGGKFLYVPLEKSDGSVVYGYVPENFTVDVLSENKEGKTYVSQIKNENSSSFKNAVIVIALAASVFGTSVFFIVKKKS